IGAEPPQIKIPASLICIFGAINSMIGRISGKSPAITKEIAKLSVGYHCYSGEKARRELNMPCTDLSIAAKECKDWFVANGYLN
ncbi:MAG: hypothetical protein ACOVPB_11070, partial [Bacteroidia bacterium]